MAWNFRVVRRYYVCPVEMVERSYLANTEVYYDDDSDERPRAFAGKYGAPTAEEGEGVDAIRWMLEKQLEDVNKPILDERTDFRVPNDRAF